MIASSLLVAAAEPEPELVDVEAVIVVVAAAAVGPRVVVLAAAVGTLVVEIEYNFAYSMSKYLTYLVSKESSVETNYWP